MSVEIKTEENHSDEYEIPNKKLDDTEALYIKHEIDEEEDCMVTDFPMKEEEFLVKDDENSIKLEDEEDTWSSSDESNNEIEQEELILKDEDDWDMDESSVNLEDDASISSFEPRNEIATQKYKSHKANKTKYRNLDVDDNLTRPEFYTSESNECEAVDPLSETNKNANVNKDSLDPHSTLMNNDSDYDNSSEDLFQESGSEYTPSSPELSKISLASEDSSDLIYDETIDKAKTSARGKKSRSKKVNKKACCVYCKKLVIKLPQHLEQKHKLESDVVDYLLLPKGSKERKQKLLSIRNNGNYKFNFDILKDNGATSKLILRKKVKAPDKNYLPCDNCFGFYSFKFLSVHRMKCGTTHVRNAKHITNSRALLPVDNAADKMMKTKILPGMRRDNITDVVQNDKIILLYGSFLATKYIGQKSLVNVIRQRMRLLGRLLIQFSEMDTNTTSFVDVLQAKNYDSIVSAIKYICKYDSETNASGYKSLGSKYGVMLTQLCHVYRTYLIQNTPDLNKLQPLLKQIKLFLNVLDTRFNTDISKSLEKSFQESESEFASSSLETSNITLASGLVSDLINDKMDNATTSASDSSHMKLRSKKIIEKKVKRASKSSHMKLSSEKINDKKVKQASKSSYMKLSREKINETNVKQACCVYCKKLVVKLPQHLEQKHNLESDVVDYLLLPKGSKDRKQKLISIRNKGNYKFNVDILKNKAANTKLILRKKVKVPNKNYLSCDGCFGFYNPKYLSVHRMKCVPTDASKKRNENNVKKACCVYCKKLVVKLPQHLEQKHNLESDVVDYLLLPKGSKDRKQKLISIRNKGNYKFNSDILKDNGATTTLILRKKVKASNKNYLPCDGCFGFYSHKYLSVHRMKCVATYVRNAKHITNSQALLPVDNAADEMMKTKILPGMLRDNITDVVQNDKIILLYGSFLATKYIAQKYLLNAIRQRMRQLGRLLIQLSEIDTNTTSFVDVLQVKNYESIVLAIKYISKYDSETNVSGFKSLSSKYGAMLMQICHLYRKYLIENTPDLNELEPLLKQIKLFLNVLHTGFNTDTISKSFEEPFQESESECASSSLKSSDITLASELPSDLIYDKTMDKTTSASNSSCMKLSSKKINEKKVEQVSDSSHKKLPSKEINETNVKQACCVYCKKLVVKLPQHLEQKHKLETDVVDYLLLPKGSKDRKQKLLSIRNKGNYKFNSDILKDNGATTTLILRKKVKTSNKNYLPCDGCFGFYSQKYLSVHKMKCVTTHVTNAKHDVLDTDISKISLKKHEGSNLNNIDDLVPISSDATSGEKNMEEIIQENLIGSNLNNLNIDDLFSISSDVRSEKNMEKIIEEIIQENIEKNVEESIDSNTSTVVMKQTTPQPTIIGGLNNEIKGRKMWSTVEKSAVYNHFQEHFVKLTLPSTKAIIDCIHLEPALQSRTWSQIKGYINNMNKKKRQEL